MCNSTEGEYKYYTVADLGEMREAEQMERKGKVR